MRFEPDNRAESVGKWVGFLFSYFLASTFLFFAFSFSGRLPSSLPFLKIAGFVLLLMLIGAGLRRWL